MNSGSGLKDQERGISRRHRGLHPIDAAMFGWVAGGGVVCALLLAWAGAA